MSNNTIPFKYSDVELNVSNRAPPPLQVARFAAAQKEKNARYLDITTVYDGTPLKGMRVLVTGGEQNLGLEIVKEIVAQGGEAISAGRTSSKDLDEAAAASGGKIQVITDIDVCKEEAMAKMVAEVEGPLDMVINNAGYFYGPEEKVGVGGEEGHLNFQHQMLQVRRARERSRRGRRARDRATTTARSSFSSAWREKERCRRPLRSRRPNLPPPQTASDHFFGALRSPRARRFGGGVVSPRFSLSFFEHYFFFFFLLHTHFVSPPDRRLRARSTPHLVGALQGRQARARRQAGQDRDHHVAGRLMRVAADAERAGRRDELRPVKRVLFFTRRPAGEISCPPRAAGEKTKRCHRPPQATTCRAPRAILWACCSRRR